jgi:L-arabinose isomerase
MDEARMKIYGEKDFWFITGSQNIYGSEVLEKVASNSKKITNLLNKVTPANVVYKGIVTGSDEILSLIEGANYNSRCVGIITWMHTFSPSKMWINGLKILNKPILHLHTQFNKEIPFNYINMDFMNLNQSAHGDREFGFICRRLKLPAKVIVGHWHDKSVHLKIGEWMRSAIGISEGKTLKVARFGDNMREVAVTEGDKIEAQIKLGWSVNTFAIGELAERLSLVSEKEIENLFNECQKRYLIKSSSIKSTKYQLRIEVALQNLLDERGIKAFTTTFEDLWGLEQLPGLACQMLMEKGYGFGPEGDWKTAALLRIIKIMQKGLAGGSSFMEDYTYHLIKDNELVLGSHMLEICPSIADGKVVIDAQPLSIGGKADPARMVFDGHSGKAILISLVDMGDRFRLICADIEAVKPISKMPKLPVACVMWYLLPDFKTGTEAWILAGGAHHSVLSYSVTADMLRDYAEMANIEFIHIGNHTDINELKKDLKTANIVWKI